MRFQTNITEYNESITYQRKCLRRIDGLLYNVTINQTIQFLYDGKKISCKVINIVDSVYEDIIYRYIEVLIMN